MRELPLAYLDTGYIAIHRETERLLDFTFALKRDDTVAKLVRFYRKKAGRSLRRHFKIVPASRTIHAALVCGALNKEYMSGNDSAIVRYETRVGKGSCSWKEGELVDCN